MGPSGGGKARPIAMAQAIEQFEKLFAQWLGGGQAFAFWKGRVAMYAILRAMGVGAGDEVVCPGYTCVMAVNPIVYVGAVPTFVDIAPETFNVAPELLEKRITPRTKAIVAQHTYGIPCQMDAIMDIASRHGLPVVEDCCLAMGSTFAARLCGTFGLAAFWSFQWNKPFTTGIGGMATTSDAELAGKIDELCSRYIQSPSAQAATMLWLQRVVYRLFIYPRTNALATSLFRWLTRKGVVVGSSSTAEFAPEMPGDFFASMGAAQARAGRRQMRKIQANIDHRRAMRAVYDRLLGEAGLPIVELPAEMDPVLVRYPVRVADKQQAVAAAPRSGVEIGTWFECPLHPQETPMEAYGYTAGMCPAAERASREVVNLPMHMRANEAVAARSVEFIRKIGPA